MSNLEAGKILGEFILTIILILIGIKLASKKEKKKFTSRKERKEYIKKGIKDFKLN